MQRREFATVEETVAVMARHDAFAKRHEHEAKRRTAFSGMRAGGFAQGQPGQWAEDHREEANHFTGWNYIAIRAIALQAAGAIVSVYGGDTVERRAKRLAWRRKGYGFLTPDDAPMPDDHPLVELMNRPSPTQSGASFRYEQIVQLSLTGTCLIWKVRNAYGLTIQRYVVPTAIAQPNHPSREYPNGYYRIQNTAIASTYDSGFASMLGSLAAMNNCIPAEDVMVIRWPHPLFKDDGYSALAAGSKQIDTAEQIDTARWSHLQHGPNASLYVTPGDDCSPDEAELDAAAKKFNDKYAGAGNAGKAIFGTQGSSVEKLSSSPDEMAYDSAYIQMRDTVLALHGTPGIAAGITDGGSYAAFYASLKQFSILTVQPTLDLIAGEETEQQAPEFGPALTVELEAAAIDDPDVLEKQLATDVAAGCRTVNEFRALRGLEPHPDGDVLVKSAAPAAAPGATAQTTGVVNQGTETRSFKFRNGEAYIDAMRRFQRTFDSY